MRVSYNEFKSSKFEVGNTSNWVVQFERPPGGISGLPDPNSLNLINNLYTPAIDVNYDQHNVLTKEITVGPGIKMEFPILLEDCRSVSLTVLEEHNKLLRSAIRDWAAHGLGIAKGRAPKLSDIIKSSMILKINHFDKGLKALSGRSVDSYYVIPSKEMTFRGDQAFQPETLPLTFMVVGRYSDL